MFVVLSLPQIHNMDYKLKFNVKGLKMFSSYMTLSLSSSSDACFNKYHQ